jgi:HlyD family secretion protein
MFGFLKRPMASGSSIVLVVVSSSAAACHGQKAGEAKKAEAEKRPRPPEVESPYAAIANGKADVEGGIIQVAARRGGVVQEVYVQEGDRVVAGQILARQEDDEPRLAVSRAQAEVAQAQAPAGQSAGQSSPPRASWSACRTLAGDSNFVAAQRLDQARDDDRVRPRPAIERPAGGRATAQRPPAGGRIQSRADGHPRADQSGRIVRRYANPGAGASTLNVSNMFDLEPDTPRIVRAEIVESDIPNVTDRPGRSRSRPRPTRPKVYVGHGPAPRRRVRRPQAGLGRPRPALATSGWSRSWSAPDDAPLLIGQRVLVKFMKPGFKAGEKRLPPKPAGPPAK